MVAIIFSPTVIVIGQSLHSDTDTFLSLINQNHLLSAKLILVLSECKIILDAFEFVEFSNLNFLNCSPTMYRSFNFALAKVVALNLFALLFVQVLTFVHGFSLYGSSYSHRSAYYCDSNSCHYFFCFERRLKTLFAIAFKNKKERKLFQLQQCEE